MALLRCKDCGNQISNHAVACSQCGAEPRKRTSLFTWIVGGLFTFGVVCFINGKLDTDSELQRQASPNQARVPR